MVKYTPGPWEVIKENMTEPGYKDFVRRLKIVKREESELGQILRIIAKIDWNNPQEANAHLIAAAPEMYKELKAHCNDCDGRRFADHYGDEYCGDCKTRAALAKAEGRRE